MSVAGFAFVDDAWHEPGEARRESGITFQQIQKYEKGTNLRRREPAAEHFADTQRAGVRSSSRMLRAMAAAPAGDGRGVELQLRRRFPVLLGRACSSTRAFVKISDPKVRRKLVDLVKAPGRRGGERIGGKSPGTKEAASSRFFPYGDCCPSSNPADKDRRASMCCAFRHGALPAARSRERKFSLNSAVSGNANVVAMPI